MYSKKVWKSRVIVLMGVIALLLLAISFSFMETNISGLWYAILWTACICIIRRFVQRIEKKSHYC